ncbi:MAG: hypothetical protein ACP5U1_14755, partial [Desulfomonilaceae bacterium]
QLAPKDRVQVSQTFGPLLKPLDPEQMKIKLTEKLEDLKQEFDVLKKLPGFRFSFDFDSTEKMIHGLADDADFEKIQNKIHRQFEVNHEKVNRSFVELEDALASLIREADLIDQRMSSSRHVASLKSAPTGLSKWCADLNTYIVANLAKTVKEFRTECNDIEQKANGVISEYVTDKKGPETVKIRRILDGWEKHASINKQLKGLKDNVQHLDRKLVDYDQWVRLLTPSDDLYKQLIEMQKDDAHMLVSSQLLKEIESVWEDISDHLRLRSVNGLGAYNHYFEKFQDIETKRKKYLQGLRGKFEAVKDKVNLFLKDLEVGTDSRANVVFNPDDSNGCYDQLFNQALQQLLRICEGESRDLSEQRLDLLYNCNVLKRVSLEEVSPLIEKIDKCEKDLNDLSKTLNVNCIKAIIEGDGKQDFDIDVAKNATKRASNISREVRKTIIEKTKQKTRTEASEEPNEMLKLIPEGQVIDLKQLIVKMLKEDQPPAGILESALKTLSELFMDDKVQIKLELPRRR